MIRITPPTGLDLQAWADRVALDLDGQGAVGRLQDDDWQRWGEQLTGLLGVGALVPNPNLFSDWHDWAERLCFTMA